jgi:DNA (cytosine-5)-methyltransferase 1
MPVECERLQGLPDDWTRYGRREDGEVYELADGPRYKMIGNGGYVGAVEWIARRIIDTGRRSHTLNTTAERATRET